jgi:hypothetical protein
MSDALPPPPTKEAEKAASIVSQGVALLSVICLAAALLYNVILFYFIDTSLITAFTISDHIATAIEMLPLAFVMVLIIFVRFPISVDTSRQAWTWLLCLPVVGVVEWIVASWIGRSRDGGVLFAMSLAFAWAIGGDYLVRQALSNTSRAVLLAVRLVGSLFAVVVYNAVAIGVSLRDPGATHVLTLGDKSKLEAHLIQILERGVVLISVPDKAVLFIPKDEVKRIEKLKR